MSEYSKKSAFAVYDTKQTNEQWSWSAISEDKKTVAVTIWQDLIKFDENKHPFYDSFSTYHEETIPLGLWRDAKGNKERIKFLRHTIENLNGLVRVVVVKASDKSSYPRSVKSVFPYQDLWFRITNLDEETGQFSLKFSHRDK